MKSWMTRLRKRGWFIGVVIILCTSVVLINNKFHTDSSEGTSLDRNVEKYYSPYFNSNHELNRVALVKKLQKKNTLRKSTSNSNNKWVLDWSDEFNELSTDHWILLEDANGYGNRKQHYKPENLSIVDGKLKISILKQKSGKYAYTSGAIISKTKVHFMYGRLEIRAKFPKGTGLIPAIWMLPSNGKQFPEIDIAEIIGQEPKELWNVVHDEKRGKHVREYNLTTTTVDLTKDYHVYGIQWTPRKIEYTFDGKIIFTGKKLIPNEAMYLYINVGVGGDWVGEPNKYTKFPNEMLIDYVRYYVREE